MKILELFGGIGACSNALKRLGIDFEIADYVEIDKHAVKSFNAIYNTNFEPQDVKEWNKDLEVDLIMHGSPCQDFSIAGRQAGGDEGSGTRSSLMYETIRIIEKLKPKYVIWENVKNLLSKKHKPNFDNYINRLNELGYKSFCKVLNAKDYGIPQNRERVFTISIRNDLNQPFEFPPKKKLKLKLKDMLEKNIDNKYYLSKNKIYSISHWKSYQKPFEKIHGNNSISQTLTARGAGEEHSGMIVYSSELYETTNLQNECFNIFESGDIKINDLRIRKLTPKECWRLMGFSDEDFEKAKRVNSDTQLYRQAGNSIVVNVLVEIFNNLFVDYSK